MSSKKPRVVGKVPKPKLVGNVEVPQPFVVFCVPSLGRNFCVDFLMSAMATQNLLFQNSISQVWRVVGGDPYLAKVRNRLASEFLQNFPDATDLFFLDDDMGWPAEKVLDFIRRPEALLVGAYPKKLEAVEYPIEITAGEDGKAIERDGYVQTNLAPTGFMRVKRHVFEAMAKESGRYREWDQDESIGDIWCWDMFRMGYAEYEDKKGEGKWWGEDYFFCSRWRAMGGEIWCDPDIPFTHTGRRVWKGTFKDELVKRGLLEAPQEYTEAAE